MGASAGTGLVYSWFRGDCVGTLGSAGTGMVDTSTRCRPGSGVEMAENWESLGALALQPHCFHRKGLVTHVCLLVAADGRQLQAPGWPDSRQLDLMPAFRALVAHRTEDREFGFDSGVAVDVPASALAAMRAQSRLPPQPLPAQRLLRATRWGRCPKQECLASGRCTTVATSKRCSDGGTALCNGAAGKSWCCRCQTIGP